MKIYTMHIKKGSEKPEDTAKFVPEEFSWMAMIFPFNIFQCIFRRTWFFLALIVLVEVITAYMQVQEIASKSYLFAFKFPWLIFLGMMANDFWRNKLESQGYSMEGVVSDYAVDKKIIEQKTKMVMDLKNKDQDG